MFSLMPMLGVAVCCVLHTLGIAVIRVNHQRQFGSPGLTASHAVCCHAW